MLYLKSATGFRFALLERRSRPWQLYKEPPGRRQRNPPGGVWSKVADAIVDLLKVRSIVTIIVISVMSVMAIREAIDPGAFLAVAGSIIAYYFTRKDRPP